MRKIVFLGLFWGLTFLPFAHAQEKAELTKYSGSVEVLLQGDDSYTEAQEGMELQAGDKIKTGSGAYAELSFNEDNTNILRVEENTTAGVLLSGDEKVELEQGEVFATIESLPSGSGFEIRTPTAVSGARGTDWVTKVTDEGTDVEAIDSTPYVKHFEKDGVLAKETTFISAGQMTKVKKFQKPTMLLRVPEDRRQKFQAMKKDVNNHAKEAIMKRKERPAFDRKDFLEKVKNKRQGKDLSQFNPDKPKPKDNPEGLKPLISKEGEFGGNQESFVNKDNNLGVEGQNNPEKKFDNGQMKPPQGDFQKKTGRGNNSFDKKPFPGNKPLPGKKKPFPMK